MLPKKDMDLLISSIDSNEYYNSISHLIGAILSFAGMIVLIVFSALDHNIINIISFSIYGTTLLLSFIASCLLHFYLLFNKYSRILGILDHCAIYLLIAGTYTPICLIVLGGGLGWTLFGIIWGLAIFCITIKAIFFKQMPKIASNITYLTMGWIVVLFIYPIYLKLHIHATILIFFGGLFYTIGALIFTHEKPNPWPPNFGNHELWHTAVLLGNLTFFIVMLQYILPY